LKAFSVQKKKKRQVQVFDKKTHKNFAAATDNVALEGNFNTIDVEGFEPDFFEKSVAQVESELAPTLERVIESQSLQTNADDYAIVLNFITMLALRNPRQRFSRASNEAGNEYCHIYS
jgi:hypothetical protein